MNKSSLSREECIGGWSMLKKCDKGMHCQKRFNPQKGHPAKAAATAVNQMLQESQAKAVSPETLRSTTCSC